MNDMKFMLEHMIASSGGIEHASLYELHHFINLTPFKAIGMGRPIDSLREFLT